MVVIVTVYMLFVTSQCDVTFTFANRRFGEVCWHNIHIIPHAFSLLVAVQCCQCNELLSALQVRRLEQNTALIAKTEQFITAKISCKALKQGFRTQSMLRQRSSQLQNKDARCKSEVKHSTLRQGSSQLQKHQAARISRRIAVEQRRYAAGMADSQNLQQGSQTQITPRAKWWLVKQPEGRIMTLTQQWRYLNLFTYQLQLFHIIFCERYHGLQANNF